MPVGTRTSRGAGNHKRDAASTSNHSKRLRSKNTQAQNTTLNIESAKRSYERYIALAKNALSAGDAVEIENYYQHADHYFRQMNRQPV